MSINDRPANVTPSILWLLASPIGRAARQPYWLGFVLVWAISGIALRMWFKSLDPNVPMAFEDVVGFADSNPLFPFLFFALQWVELALVIKRCQDIGISGFSALLILIPGVNVIAVLVFGLLPSSSGPNRYGPLPNSYFRRKT